MNSNQIERIRAEKQVPLFIDGEFVASSTSI